ncbi:MAG: hypothetical protein OXU66_05350 [Gammaproteobacteria bacterium]|nr:hypothetical protein [Gammaproteobacteria bacterium]MDD9895185.1 hypothetical protein [Gammaproteobacteria bacterium]MDD9958349.1 hypothetical protein [Gammaproteobacteria bacterium]
MKDKALHTLLSWARVNNSIITYAQLTSQLPDNIDSQEEIDSIIEFLISNYVSLFDSMPPYVKQEEVLRNKIEKTLDRAETEALTDEDEALFDNVSSYYAAYDNRSWDFASCSKGKQEERLEELGTMLSDLCSCLR